MIDPMKSRIETVLRDAEHLRHFIPGYDAMATTIDCLVWCQSLPTDNARKFSVISGDRFLAKYSQVGPVVELVADPRDALWMDREPAFSIQFQLDGREHRRWKVGTFDATVALVAQRKIEELALAIEFALSFQKVLDVRRIEHKAKAFLDVEFKVASLLAMIREASSEQFVVQVDNRFVQMFDAWGAELVDVQYGEIVQAHLFSKEAAYGRKFLLEAEGEGDVQVVSARSAAIESCRQWTNSIAAFLSNDVH